MTERVPASLLAALTDLVYWLDAAKVPSMVIGGVAASILGQPRLTQDVDALALLPESDWARVIAAAGRHGIVPRIENPLEFARRSRVLIMKAVAGRPKDLQDIEGLLATNPKADIAIARQWFREFATAMTMPGMLEEFNKLVAQRK